MEKAAERTKKTSKQNQIREAVLLYDQYRYPKTPEEKAAREDALLTIFRLYDGDIRYISGRLRNRYGCVELSWHGITDEDFAGFAVEGMLEGLAHFIPDETMDETGFYLSWCKYMNYYIDGTIKHHVEAENGISRYYANQIILMKRRDVEFSNGEFRQISTGVPLSRKEAAVMSNLRPMTLAGIRKECLISHPLPLTSRADEEAEDTGYAVLSKKEEEKTVRAFLRTLPLKDRMLFVRHFAEGVTIPALAHRYGMTNAAVSWSLNQTKRAARAYFANLDRPLDPKTQEGKLASSVETQTYMGSEAFAKAKNIATDIEVEI